MIFLDRLALIDGILLALCVGAFFLLSKNVNDTVSKAQHVPEPKEPLKKSLRDFVNTLPEPCMIIDQDLSLNAFNEAAQTFLLELKAGQPLTHFLRDPTLLTALQDAFTHRTKHHCELYEKVPSERWFSVHIAVLELSKNKRQAVLILHDLTEMRRIERMRTDFIANASHELRTPLASLIGFIETLLGAARHDDDARARFLIIMKDQAERMSRLIDDLMSLSKIEMRAHLMPENPVCLKNILQNVMASMEPLAKKHSVSLIFHDQDHGQSTVLGDRDELIQVLSNLIENALKYAHHGQRIELRLDSLHIGKQPYLDLSVRDYGKGIREDHLPRLTERFYRGDVEKSQSKKGTGLGLAIVKHILNRHKGQLLIKSTLGEGSVFTMRLPLYVNKGKN